MSVSRLQPGERHADAPKQDDASSIGSTQNDASKSTDDLHVKMSKKIAQLTKVIYHLNTKNEDHHSEVQGLQQSYETEIDQILKDAYTKMNSFREKVSSEFDEKKITAHMKRIEHKYVRECKGFKTELADVRREASERELKLQKQGDEHVKNVTNEVKCLRKKFQSRFEELKNVVKETEKHHKLKLQEENTAHQKEIADLVTKSNLHYNTMLAERLKAEDALRQELLSEREDLINEIRVKNNDKLAKLATEMALKEAHILDESDRVLSERNQRIINLESTISDMQSMNNKTQTLANDNARITENLQSQIVKLKEQQRKELTQSVSEIEELDVRRKAVHTELMEARRHISELRADVSDRETQLTKQRKKITDTNNAVSNTLRTVENERDASIESEKVAKRMLNECALKLRTSEAERSALDVDLSDERRRLQEADDDIDNLKKRVVLEQTHTAELALARSANDTQWLKRVEDANIEMQKLRLKLQEELEQHQYAWATEKETLRAKNVEAMQRMREEEEMKSAESVASINKELLVVKEALQLAEHRSEQRENNFHRSLEQTVIEAEIAQKGALVDLREMLQSEFEKERACWIQHKRSFIIEAESLRVEIGKMKKTTADACKRIADLDMQLCSAKEENIADQQKLTQLSHDRVEHALSKAKAEHQSALQAAVQKYQADLETMQGEFDTQKKELSSEAERVAEQCSTMQNELAAANLKSSCVFAELEQARRQHDIDTKKYELRLIAVKEASENDKSMLRKEQLELHKKNCEEIAAEHAKSLQSREFAFNEEREQKRISFKKHTDEMLAAQQSRVDEVERALMLQRHEELQKLREDASMRIEQTREQHRAEVVRLDAYHQRQQELVQKEREKHERDKDARREEQRRIVNELQNTIEAKSAEIEKQRKQLQSIMTEFAEANERTIRIEMAKKAELECKQNEFSRQMKEFQFECDIVKQRQEVAHSHTRKRLDELEKRFRNRESRKEDTEQIRELELAVAKQRNVVEQTLNEIKFYKLELQNREENYNQRFGGGPKVGVMNVIKKNRRSEGVFKHKRNYKTALNSNMKAGNTAINMQGCYSKQYFPSLSKYE